MRMDGWIPRDLISVNIIYPFEIDIFEALAHVSCDHACPSRVISLLMDSNNPASSFFDEEDVDLYAVLGLGSTATEEEIKKAYRKSALIYHPDKHVSSTEDAKQAASRKFQQVGFAYAVLGDKKRRAKYDTTGSTEDGFDLADGEDGWEAYFEALFESVTRNKLDQLKKEYQGERAPFSPPVRSVCSS